MSAPPFFPSEPPAHPLGRYLPLLGEQAAAGWLAHQGIEPPAWVLDPFGMTPWVAAHLARAGYTVVVSAFNPVLRFLHRIAAQPLALEDLQAALAALAAARKGNERIQPHIESLYHTTCRRCNQTIAADSFLWEREGSAPFRVRYRCPHCEAEGDHPADERDSARAMRFVDASLHRNRALERIAPLHDPDREHAARALEVYPARAVYALSTLINKRPTLNLSPRRMEALDALLLSALDAGTALWPLGATHRRPRQVHLPARYVEHNLWKVLEQATQDWAEEAPKDASVPLSIWPEQPARGGLLLFPGRLRNLAAQLEQLPLRAVVTVLPRPHQAFWTLSALWSGWLWGPASVADFKVVLRRQRYDWKWHTAAIQAAWTHLQAHLPADLPCLTLIPELESGLLIGALLGVQRSGLRLEGLALRTAPPEAQVSWCTGATPSKSGSFEEAARQGIRQALQAAGQPLPALLLQAAALERGLPVLSRHRTAGEAFGEVRRVLAGVLQQGPWVVFEAEGREPLYWLRETPPDLPSPWFDRLERALVNTLLRQPLDQRLSLEAALCRAFPGLLTPPRPLIHALLHSYTLQERLALRPEDHPARRRHDLNAIAALVRNLGRRFGFQVPEDPPLRWVDAQGAVRYRFHIQASALVHHLLQDVAPTEGTPVLVLPGGRAALFAFKKQHDPRLESALQRHGWLLLKFRLVRRLAEMDSLDPASLPDLLQVDPITYNAPQIPLL